MVIGKELHATDLCGRDTANNRQVPVRGIERTSSTLAVSKSRLRRMSPLVGGWIIDILDDESYTRKALLEVTDRRVNEKNG